MEKDVYLILPQNNGKFLIKNQDGILISNDIETAELAERLVEVELEGEYKTMLHL